MKWIKVGVNGESWEETEGPEVEHHSKKIPSMSDLMEENALLKAQLQAQSDRSDFIEDCIAEMAIQVYGGV